MWFTMPKTKLFRLLFIFTISLFVVIQSCSKDSTEPVDTNSDIPGDPQNVTVPSVVVNNLKPNASFKKTDGNTERVRLNLLGMLTSNGVPFNPSYDTGNPQNSNIFITEDGAVKGIKISEGGQANLPIDMVFTVDNSGSMSQEADSVAAGIVEFATYLVDTKGFDIQFGCVGFLGAVSGALNLGSAAELNRYLNERTYFGVPVTGTSRTSGFAGDDSLQLLTSAQNYFTSGENGVTAIFFARDNFTWRENALKIYVNFTDEPTQPGGQYKWSTDSLCKALEGTATVHTVWSAGDTTFFGNETPLFYEKPWRMSQCTGGELRVFDGTATGLRLLDLPVRDVVEGSRLIEFVSSDPAATHTITITVKNGTTDDGRTVYENVTY